MDIFFQDPREIPLPPDEVRIKDIKVHPTKDGSRVKVTLEIDPFQKRPNLDLIILDQEGNIMANTSIIESIQQNMELTLHLKKSATGHEYTLKAVLFYYQEPNRKNDSGNFPTEPYVVDRAQESFTINME